LAKVFPLKRSLLLIVLSTCWMASTITVAQQIREGRILRAHSEKWDEYSSYELPQRFAGRTISVTESAVPLSSHKQGELEAKAAIMIDGKTALSESLVHVDQSRSDLARYHRWITETRFRSLESEDSLMVLARQRIDSTGTRFDVVTIDRNGRERIQEALNSISANGILVYRALGQLGQETQSYLTLAEWTIFPGFFLRILAPWVVSGASSLALGVVLYRILRKTARR
jgi:hypothetical protein